MGRREVVLGRREVAFGDEVAAMREADDLRGDPAALRARLDEDGYLLLRRVHPPERVAAARRVVVEALRERGRLADGADGDDLRGRGMGFLGDRAVTHHGDFLALVESPELFAFFADLFGEPALTYDWKWMRAVGDGDATGAHMDTVYMGRGSRRLHTCWIAVGDVSLEEGALAICEGSHRAGSLARVRETYGRMDVDRDRTEGWFSEDPMEIAELGGGRWCSTDFRAGDVVVFGIHLFHASLRNRSGRLRLSCDTRFQPASEPADERWVGERPVGHSSREGEPPRSMAEARAEWGV